jgi:hypothetical protein
MPTKANPKGTGGRMKDCYSEDGTQGTAILCTQRKATKRIICNIKELQEKINIAIEALEDVEEFSGYDETIDVEVLSKASEACCRIATEALKKIKEQKT